MYKRQWQGQHEADDAEEKKKKKEDNKVKDEGVMFPEHSTKHV